MRPKTTDGIPGTRPKRPFDQGFLAVSTRFVTGLRGRFTMFWTNRVTSGDVVYE